MFFFLMSMSLQNNLLIFLSTLLIFQTVFGCNMTTFIKISINLKLKKFIWTSLCFDTTITPIPTHCSSPRAASSLMTEPDSSLCEELYILHQSFQATKHTHTHTHIEEVCVSEREAVWVEGNSILGDSFLFGCGFTVLYL